MRTPSALALLLAAAAAAGSAVADLHHHQHLGLSPRQHASAASHSDLALAKRAVGTDVSSGGVVWQYQGCVQDGAKLLLQDLKLYPADNSPQVCIDLCAASGYLYAGVELETRCFCGASLYTASGLGATIADSRCQETTCPGDSSLYCGGSKAMILYKKTLPTLSTKTIASGDTRWTYEGCVQDGAKLLLQDLRLTPADNSPAVCVAACLAAGFSYAGVELETRCFCSNSLYTASGLGATIDDARCQETTCPGDRQAYCGGSKAMILYKQFPPAMSKATITSGDSKWTWEGCVQDGAKLLLQDLKLYPADNTPAVCVAACLAAGFSYAGVELGTRCFCGSSLNTASGLGGTLDDARCQETLCPGNVLQYCGGSKSMILYKKYAPALSKASITSGSTTWAFQGCVEDGAKLLLQGLKAYPANMTPTTCVALCRSKGFTYSGVELGTRCFCGSSLYTASGLGGTLDDARCQETTCAGDSTLYCGGSKAMILYKSSAATTTSSSSVVASSTSSAAPTQTTGPGGCPAGGSAVPTLSAPKSSSAKYVFSHHMVGNTYPYTQASWLADIEMARDQGGVDAFALNLGSDQQWQPSQIANAYAAAASAGAAFKLFFSFDMSVFTCGDLTGSIYNYIKTYGKHANQFRYDGKILVSTFAGESCGDGAWSNLKNTLSNEGYAIYFLPAFFDSVDWSSWSSIDGMFAWNSAWSMDANDITTATDSNYLARVGSKSYMPGVSPLFFTHYAPSSYDKNWIYQSDGWQYAIRWEQIVAMRDKTDFVEQITWNDYGESHYIGPIAGAQPNSQAWVDGFDHTAFLAVTEYYSQAFKTGTYPTIACDVVYVMTRPHINTAVATNDVAGPPTLTQNGAANSYLAETNDFFVLVFATAAGTVRLTSGSSVKSFTVPAGITRLEAPLTAGAGINVKLIRNSKNAIDYTPSFTFAATTTTYNFNYYVFASNE